MVLHPGKGGDEKEEAFKWLEKAYQDYRALVKAMDAEKNAKNLKQ